MARSRKNRTVVPFSMLSKEQKKAVLKVQKEMEEKTLSTAVGNFQTSLNDPYIEALLAGVCPGSKNHCFKARN